MVTARQYKTWDPNEVSRVVRWWLSKSNNRRRTAMAVGGFAEVVQEVYVDLLRYPPKDGYKLTTIICQQTTWTLHRMAKKISKCKPAGKCTKVPDQNATRQSIEAADQTHFVWQTLRSVLDTRTAWVICQRVEGKAFAELAERLCIHTETARQIYCTGIARLQNHAAAAAERLRQELLF